MRRALGEDATDEDLVRRFLEGSEASFRILYRRHTPRLRMLVLRLVGHREQDAEDVVQESWLAACGSMRQFRGDARFGTWLTTIALRVARRRSAAAVKFGDDAAGDLDAAAAIVPDIDAEIDAERALAMLSPRARIVFLLHYFEGFSHEEIARELDIAPGTSRSILARALIELRNALAPGVSPHGRSHTVSD